ncbi:MAG TPA: biotin--[acetyl-CoA-carboxylase] ligase [Acidisarcina sp.]|nr:biotin--[acetyl-CoA-carboxylase] ligase [Acidisarcina sp.]
MADTLNISALNQALVGTPFAGHLRHFASLPSTNSLAMQEAGSGAPHGSVYLADEQTAGRGRGDHDWHSEPGSGIYLSVLLRPAIAPADVLWLSLAAGLAVSSAIRQVTTLEPDLRWPNDLLFGSRKFCGILTELHAEVTRVHHAVIGIGINVHQEAFRGELRHTATSLRIESGREWPRQEIVAALLQSLHRETVALTSSATAADAAARIPERVEKISSWIRGKRVTVDEAEGFSGVTEGLDPRGFLLVRTSDGLRTVLSGSVREAKSNSFR